MPCMSGTAASDKDLYQSSRAAWPLSLSSCKAIISTTQLLTHGSDVSIQSSRYQVRNLTRALGSMRLGFESHNGNQRVLGISPVCMVI